MLFGSYENLVATFELYGVMPFEYVDGYTDAQKIRILRPPVERDKPALRCINGMWFVTQTGRNIYSPRDWDWIALEPQLAKLDEKVFNEFIGFLR